MLAPIAAMKFQDLEEGKIMERKMTPACLYPHCLMVTMTEKDLFKSFLLRLIHCTDGARYEEHMVDDYWALICDMKREYQEKYGEEVE